MKADAYRRYAAECLELANQIESLDCRAILRTMAVAWVNLAEHAEKNTVGPQIEPLKP